MDTLHRGKKAKYEKKVKELSRKAVSDLTAPRKYEKAEKHYPKEHFAKKIK